MAKIVKQLVIVLTFTGLLLAFRGAEGALPATGEWILNTQSCLFRMSLGARFSIPYTTVDGQSQIKEQDLTTGAILSDSTCTDSTVKFNLRYYLSSVDPDNYHWAYIMEFTKGNDNDYMLKKVTVQYVLDSRFSNPAKAGTVVTETTQDVQPSAKLGTYLGTDSVSFKVGTSRIGVLMTSVKLQPFERSVKGGGYGTETMFTPPPPVSMTTNDPGNNASPVTMAPNDPGNNGGGGNTVLIIVCVIVAIAAMSLTVAAVVFFILKRNRSQTTAYSDIKY